MSLKRFFLLLGLVVFFWFAWFELRPFITKAWCSSQNRDTFNKLSDQGKRLVAFDPEGHQLLENKYKNCLRMFAL